MRSYWKASVRIGDILGGVLTVRVIGVDINEDNVRENHCGGARIWVTSNGDMFKKNPGGDREGMVQLS